MCFHLAALMLENREPPQSAIAVLQRALRAKPDYTEAQVQLGAVQINSHDFAGGIATLTGIGVVGPDEAPVVFCALGQAYLETGDLVSAGRNIQTCRKWAKTPAETARVEELAAVLNARRN